MASATTRTGRSSRGAEATGCHPVWDNLVTGLVGLLGLAGIIYTQRRADSREQERWERERTHEREVWSRDDAARSYDYRRQAYAAFLNEYYAIEDTLSAWEKEEHTLNESLQRFRSAFESLRLRIGDIHIFGTKAADDRAFEAFTKLLRRLDGGEHKPSWEEVSAYLHAYVDQVRRDLHVSDE
jgi:hypothetical protein